MLDRTLQDCRILVVEDEYMLAEELRLELDDAGAIVLGPVGHLEDALDLARLEEHIDDAGRRARHPCGRWGLDGRFDLFGSGQPA